MMLLSDKAFQGLKRYHDVVDDFSALVAAAQRPLPRTMWLRPDGPDLGAILEMTNWPEKAFSPLSWRQQAYRVSPEINLGGSLPYVLGHLHIQEEVSMMPPELLAPKPGERILDMCAAPGNKTAQMALMMQNTGTIIANDRAPLRLTSLRSTLSRLGICNVTTSVSDGLLLKAEPNTFDRVLCDVPCSCEATIRKNPKVMEHSLQDYTFLAGGLQVGLLRKAVELCRPGGTIVYATCTFRPEENEAVVHAVLTDGNIELAPISLPGFKASHGLTSWGPMEFASELMMTRRIWPHQNDSGGFYLAKLRKKGSH